MIIKEGETVKTPIVVYPDGIRTIIGEATVVIKNGELVILATEITTDGYSTYVDPGEAYSAYSKYSIDKEKE